MSWSGQAPQKWDVRQQHRGDNRRGDSYGELSPRIHGPMIAPALAPR